MSHIIDFYLGEKADCEGRWLEDIWNYTDSQLEYVHNWVQWLFPVREPSNFNPDAPLLLTEDVVAFKKDKLLQNNLLRSFRVFANFLGLELTFDGKVEKAEWFENRLVLWKYTNHNWLRITRVITSLGLLGLEHVADAFFQCLKQIHEKEGYISENSFNYWSEAWFITTKSQQLC